jgi:hypothetical protein
MMHERMIGTAPAREALPLVGMGSWATFDVGITHYAAQLGCALGTALSAVHHRASRGELCDPGECVGGPRAEQSPGRLGHLPEVELRRHMVVDAGLD